MLKLIALANNNPNEEEANRAARKACKLFSELKFNFREKAASIPTPGQGYSPPQWRRPTWNEGWDDILKREKERETQRREYERKQREEAEKRQQEAYDDLRNSHTKYYKYWDEHREHSWDTKTASQRHKKKEVRILKCKTCKLDKNTLFVGAAEAFECSECQWTAYLKKKPL